MNRENESRAGDVIVRPHRRPPRPQLVGETIELLRSRLGSGEFKIGDKIPSEATLIQDFGIGRTTLREAVRVLEHEGLLVVRQGAGTYLQAAKDRGILSGRLRQARVLEVLEVRRALELEITRLAASRRSDAALESIGRAVEGMRRSLKQSDKISFLEADLELFRILAAATGNPILIEIHTFFSDALRAALTQIVAIPGVMQTCLSRHEQLYEAVATRDADLAEAITKAHLERLARLTKEVLGGARVGETDKRAGAVNGSPGAEGQSSRSLEPKAKPASGGIGVSP
jgi:GntR family transcriptional regulator, transcriptional repressor for pyruvate dehydrogenase complex